MRFKQTKFSFQFFKEYEIFKITMNFGKDLIYNEFEILEEKREEIRTKGVNDLKDYVLLEIYSYLTKSNYEFNVNQIFLLKMFTLFESYLFNSLCRLVELDLSILEIRNYS